MIKAKLIYVSADAVPEQAPVAAAAAADPPKRFSFIIRVRLDEHDLRGQLLDVRPTPGMPADVYVKTGEPFSNI
jgi:HlyD family secretion protein